MAVGPPAAAPAPTASSSTSSASPYTNIIPIVEAPAALNENEYPKNIFWTHASWLAGRNDIANHGVSSGTSKEGSINKKLWYLVDETACLLRSAEVDAMTKTFIGLLFDMRGNLHVDCFPQSWGQAGKSFKDFIIHSMMTECVLFFFFSFWLLTLCQTLCSPPVREQLEGE